MRELATAILAALVLLQAAPAPAAGDADAPVAPLALDEQGRKWPADHHTMESVAALRATVASIPPTASAADLQAAGRRLDEQVQALIRGCRMTGPAHDQLHTWLLQVIPQVQALGSMSDAAAGHATLERISKSLSDFDAHFEEAPLPAVSDLRP